MNTYDDTDLKAVDHSLDSGIRLSAEGTSNATLDGADENRDGFYFEWIEGEKNITWKPLIAFMREDKR